MLRLSELPLPPVPPTARHSLRNLTSFEAERILVRATTLDYNWNFTDPQVMDKIQFDAYHRVKEMVLLPGSQYMVASVSEANGSVWSLVVYAMDVRYGVFPIAKMPTQTKAIELQAKYLTVDDVPGIVIAYVRRAWRHRGDGDRGYVSLQLSRHHL